MYFIFCGVFQFLFVKLILVKDSLNHILRWNSEDIKFIRELEVIYKIESYITLLLYLINIQIAIDFALFVVNATPLSSISSVPF
jgi:hypothetical protein